VVLGVEMAAPEISIVDLKPELADDNLRFFDDVYDNDPWLKSRDNPWWGGCYCTFYDDIREEDEINASRDKRLENRAARQKTIESGRATGLLAYADGKVVGWCNVASRGSHANPRYLKQAIDNPSEKVGSVTCFVVSSGYRKSGVARKLLESASNLVRSWDLTSLEGYPRDPERRGPNPYEVPNDNLSYHGSLNMFLRSGFRVHRKLESFIVVRKLL
jgi:GNAT superfamily N-acetyltransferase